MKEVRWLLSAFLFAFVVLKLDHRIAWSWWWVLAPLWGPFALVVLLFGISGTLEHMYYKGGKSK